MPYLSFLAINYDIPAIASAIKWFECSTLINYANPNSELYLTLVNIEQYKIVTEGTKSVVKLCPLQAKLHTTLFGQMNVLNYGFSYIFNIWIPL